MKINKQVLFIHTLRSQGYSNKDISKQFHNKVSVSTIGRITRLEQKKLSIKTEKKIQKEITGLKKSKRKSDKVLIGYSDTIAQTLESVKSSKQLKRKINEYRRSKSLVQKVIKEKLKLDKRLKEGSDTWKQKFKNESPVYQKGNISMKVF